MADLLQRKLRILRKIFFKKLLRNRSCRYHTLANPAREEHVKLYSNYSDLIPLHTDLKFSIHIKKSRNNFFGKETKKSSLSLQDVSALGYDDEAACQY
jgi:hypothetical protein